MNFESISRFQFEPIEKNLRSTQETIRITDKSVTMTSLLYERMGRPAYLSFGYDEEEKAIGVKVVDQTDPNYAEVKFEHGTVHLTSVIFLIRKVAQITGADLQKKAVVLKRGVKVNEWYVFELRNAEIVNKAGRKRTE